ncbi:Type 1 glutamine amidotransferase-like domain-containing protein [Malaciobacter mytili]|uniref:Type 1 glutamine amidotransferase-like domain-containing protein n=1 Tax=Malaciobacter mytili TaxID=603050 RepID=UPI003A8A6C71
MKGKKVTFIATAAKYEKVNFYVGTGKNALKKLGLIVDELDISSASSDDISSKIKNNDFIYVSGGNTFYLLQELKKSGADLLIAEEVNKGKIYIGESAGSIVNSPNIEYIKAMESDYKIATELTNYNALNLVDFYPVPHYSDFPFVEIAEEIVTNYGEKLNLMPISNEQVILVNGDLVAVK